MATTSIEERPHLAPHVAAVLGDLRARIRRYVWIEGLAAAFGWLGLAFWLSLAIDWFFEPPTAPRAVMLAGTSVVLAAILVQKVLYRLIVPLSDPSMATVLERRFPQLDDSLLTAVWLTGRRADGEPYSDEMLARTCREASERILALRLRDVFNYAPLRRSAAAALLLAASVAAFGMAAPDAMGVWARRSLLLGNELWPRKTHLVVEGFEQGAKKIARGADLDVVVHATADSLVIPDKVEIRYRTEGGARGRHAMTREGMAQRGEEQRYTHKFESVLTPIRFDVVGGDARVRDLSIEVVDSPTVTRMELDCEYPPYMGRAPRTFPVTGVMQMPLGAAITVRAEANKPLRRVEVDALGRDEGAEAPSIEGLAVASDGQSFHYRLPALQGDTTQVLTLYDADDIRSREPVRLALVAVADEPPQLSIRLDGIGTAITPLARLPLAGAITDDYGIDRVWFESSIEPAPPVDRPLRTLDPPVTNLELGETDAMEVRELGVEPGQKLLVSVKAADRYDLGPSGPNVGTSERWLLDVVTPEQLRSMLEARELVLRQRFEVIIQEVTDTRDLLVRVDFSEPEAKDSAGEGAPAEGTAAGEGASEASEGEATETPGEESPEEAVADTPSLTDEKQPEGEIGSSPERRLEMRKLLVERATQNCRKNTYETLSVAESFDDIRKQLVNNRIDTEELKRRIEEGIAGPLHRIAGDMFPELERRLERLERLAADPERGPEACSRARAQADEILAEMEQVLARMLELQEFNEAVEMLRLIIRLQQNLDEQTREQLKQRLRELMED